MQRPQKQIKTNSEKCELPNRSQTYPSTVVIRFGSQSIGAFTFPSAMWAEWDASLHFEYFEPLPQYLFSDSGRDLVLTTQIKVSPSSLLKPTWPYDPVYTYAGLSALADHRPRWSWFPGMADLFVHFVKRKSGSEIFFVSIRSGAVVLTETPHQRHRAGAQHICTGVVLDAKKFLPNLLKRSAVWSVCDQQIIR